MSLRLLAFAAVFALPVAAQDHHVSEENGLRVVHAWTRATTGDTATVWFEIENETAAPILLTGAVSELAGAGGLVGFSLVDGAQKLVPIPEMPLDAGAEIDFTPFGLGVGLTGLTGPLVEGEEFEITLETSAGPVEVHVLVEAANATQHSHAGHAH